MARPKRTGLDYFPLDCVLDDDMKYIDTKYEHGFKVVVKLWQKCYNTGGYFMEWNNRTKTMFAGEVKIDIETLDNILSDCFTENLFDERIFREHGILTSSGMQKRYLLVCKAAGRKNYDIKSLYLVNYEIMRINSELTISKPELTQIKPELTAKESTQSKVKESKVKESILAKTAEMFFESDTAIELALMQTRIPKAQLRSEVERFITAILIQPEKINQSKAKLWDYFCKWIKYNPPVDTAAAAPTKISFSSKYGK